MVRHVGGREGFVRETFWLDSRNAETQAKDSEFVFFMSLSCSCSRSLLSVRGCCIPCGRLGPDRNSRMTSNTRPFLHDHNPLLYFPFLGFPTLSTFFFGILPVLNIPNTQWRFTFLRNLKLPVASLTKTLLGLFVVRAHCIVSFAAYAKFSNGRKQCTGLVCHRERNGRFSDETKNKHPILKPHLLRRDR